MPKAQKPHKKKLKRQKNRRPRKNGWQDVPTKKRENKQNVKLSQVRR